MERKQKLWLAVLVLVLIIVPLVALGGYWWSRQQAQLPDWVPVLAKREVVFENHDPQVNIEFNGEDPEFKKFIKASGVFERNGVKLINDQTGKVTYVTPEKIIISFEEPTDLGKEYFSWEPVVENNILKLKFKINYALQSEEFRWQQVKSDLQFQIAFRLTQLATKHHRTGTDSEPMKAQLGAMQNLIDLDQANFIGSTTSL